MSSIDGKNFHHLLNVKVNSRNPGQNREQTSYIYSKIFKANVDKHGKCISELEGKDPDSQTCIIPELRFFCVHYLNWSMYKQVQC